MASQGTHREGRAYRMHHGRVDTKFDTLSSVLLIRTIMCVIVVALMVLSMMFAVAMRSSRTP
jgi:hypothetical protein